MRVSSQHHAPAALYPRERTPVPVVQEAGWAPEQVWTQRLEEKFFTSAEDRTLVAQSELSQHHTTYNSVSPHTEAVHVSLVRILMAVFDISHEPEGYLLF
jgi:hypothetical protein